MHYHLDVLAQDLKFALRTYRRSSGFTLTALLAIALGIGATSAVFSVTDRILFRELPYRAGNQLVSFGMVAKVVDDGEFLFAADYKNLFDATTPFQSVTSWTGVEDCDITDPNPVRQRCAEVDSSFLPVLAIYPVLGSTFSRFDVQSGAPRKVILSYGVWRSHFGGDKQIVGKTLMLDGAPARIAGVLPASFELPTL
ncbi:MAG: ABC transporter permease, partial [Bryobacteraceae bacterium]